MKFPTPYRQLHWCYLCVMNVWLLLSPSRLCAEYAMGTVPPIASLSDPRNLLTLTTFAALLSLSSYAASSRDGHHRKILFGLCLTVLPFLPASNLFFPVGFVIAERVLYIPSMGFCVLVAYGFHLLVSNLERFSPFFKAMIVFLLFVHGIKTVVRNGDWNDNFSLYSSAIRTYPRNAKMWSNLAVEAGERGDGNRSEMFFKKAIAIEPNFTTGYMNLGYLYKEENRTQDAIEVS